MSVCGSSAFPDACVSVEAEDRAGRTIGREEEEASSTLSSITQGGNNCEGGGGAQRTVALPQPGQQACGLGKFVHDAQQN